MLGKGENAGKHIFLTFSLNDSTIHVIIKEEFQQLGHLHLVICKCSLFGPVYIFSLNILVFTLHQLRNKFLQLILIFLHSASWELHQYSHQICGPINSPKVDIRFWKSNFGP